MKCNSNKCFQRRYGGTCADMTCKSETSCTQNGHGNMTCTANKCHQYCSATTKGCILTCRAKKCVQTCVNGECIMVCMPGVEECTQNCRKGSCTFRYDKKPQRVTVRKPRVEECTQNCRKGSCTFRYNGIIPVYNAAETKCLVLPAVLSLFCNFLGRKIIFELY